MNRIGLLAVMLFAVGAVWPVAAEVACVEPVEASIQAVQAEAASPLAPPCEDPACEHCVGACGHGCCHAPHVASSHTSAPALPQWAEQHEALRWASSPGAPLQAAYGLERPPRV